MTDSPFLEFRNVSKKFTLGNGDSFQAVDDVSLTIAKGEIFGIIGTTGAGKSTLLRFPNLLERPDHGSILIHGIDVTQLKGERLRNHRQKIGMVFQQFHLASNRSVFDNVAFPLKVAGLSKTSIQARVRELLALTEISEKENSYPAQLSGGQKQRVGVARALANHPDLLLCDEPTSALDPETTRSILKLLKQIRERLSITILIVTHEMAVVREICDRTAIMDKGSIVELDRTVSFFANPKSDAAKKLLGPASDQGIPPETFSGAKGRILKVIFQGGAAKNPILARVIRSTGRTPNILFSKVETILGEPVGTFFLEVDRNGESEDLKKAFTEMGAFVEDHIP
ncbi:methionine ABC transporter ATP-binding protein [Leptospira stimsonii]|uniref:Methionine ABC transporter ATP-binding protein n=1 Tax=Leptospira stimsonii TaxID=2202203 RepID=A0ABY2MZV9_9LEPT|nr:methionine ABC transporter ATP-binding protein [Leptospira stimsonii]TGK18553.1 methionine ABC transporter ATP-binding protein [Leptospira stimsonii]TGM13043.1 methionine ABC transporter ATP-binding protein [Leptospira stimsonii]